LIAWLGILRFAPRATARFPIERPWWPALGGLVIASVAGALIAAQAGGQAWGVIAIAAIAYLTVLAAAILRHQPAMGGLILLLAIQIVSAGAAFALVPGWFSLVAASLGTLLIAGGLLAGRRILPAAVAGPVDDLAALLLTLRPALPVICVAAGAGIALGLVIGGQTAAISRLLVPLAGLAASRLVAEELFLRVWLLPALERRLGAGIAILLAAAASAALAFLIRPAGLSPAAAAAFALAASIAAGVLARETRNASATVLFRLVAG
jgi:hypothetical protein